MKTEMTHWQRIRAALEGKEVDRLPVSMWRHFFKEENSADSLAEAMLGFQRRFDWDFMKVNPRASYHVEDWGVKMKYHGDAEPVMVKAAVKTPGDWQKLKVLDVNKGVLKEQLTALELIAHGLKGEVPFIMTVFTPMAIASRLTDSEDIFLQHLREHPDEVNQALEVITETYINFAKACMERGASGLFCATTAWATSDRLTEKEYLTYARPYDLRLLNALPAAEFHVLHVCRKQNLLPAVKDYPVHAFSWDARGKGNLSLAEGKAMAGGRAVIGGIAHDKNLIQASPAQLTAEVRGMRVAIGERGWILGPGCTFPSETPEANLRAIRDAAEAV
ncbi:MAG: uroporphyrinogen decarboxylase family protein [Dehalococcoidales bacterium]|nr:uroporphyrinogen decarboxylase family protein [Dehalococcoidales bacterium]